MPYKILFTGVCYLGKLYFRGWGTQQDYVKARELLEKVTWNNKEAFYMLGAIYCQGLGTAAFHSTGLQKPDPSPRPFLPHKIPRCGDAFCQYTVANSYFWWDFLRIQGRGS